MKTTDSAAESIRGPRIKKEKKDDNALHAGHRRRAKETMLNAGIDNMHDHLVMELLLFYAIPNGDTNPLAHKLIDRFGSLKGVLEADYNALLEVDGVGANTASLIKFSQKLSRRYLMSSALTENSNSLAKVESACEFCRSMFLGEPAEKVYAIALDSEVRYINRKQIGTGTVSGVDMNLRMVIDFVVKSECNNFLLTHNHPQGTCLPSKNDMIATTQLLRALKPIGIVMVDHIVVGADGVISMRNSGYCAENWNG